MANTHATFIATSFQRVLLTMINSMPADIEKFYEGPRGEIGSSLVVPARLAVNHEAINPEKWGISGEFSVDEIEEAGLAAVKAVGDLKSRFNAVVETRKGLDIGNMRKKVIGLMQLAEQFGTLQMKHFRGRSTGPAPILPLTTQKLHPRDMKTCNTTACLSGHVRLDADFNSMFKFHLGITAACIVTDKGMVLTPPETMAVILGVPVWFADLMIQRRNLVNGKDSYVTDQHILYGVRFDEVKPQQIIDIINQLEDGVTPEQILDNASTENYF